MTAEHFESDVFMKYTRGRSIILQNYLDEIATQKGKAAKTLVHKMEFLPYGLRTDTDEKRTAYTQKLMSVVKTLFQKLPGDDSTLLKVSLTQYCESQPGLRSFLPKVVH